MAIKNALKGGTDWTDGEVLTHTDLNDTVSSLYMKTYSDNTGGTTTSGTETDLATLTVAQNDLGSSCSFLIHAGIERKGSTGSGSGTFKLYVNGVAQKTITLSQSIAAGTEYSGTSFSHLISGQDSTAGNIIIKVTGSVSGNTTNVYCHGLTVLAINDNS